MPEQSIASYISNLASLGIMILIALFLFLLIFVISRILTRADAKSNGNLHEDHGDLKDKKNTHNKLAIPNKTIILNKDPNILTNLAAISFFFLMFLIFVLLSLFFLVFKELVKLKLSLFFVIFVLIFMISASIYIVKSKIFK